MRLHVFGIGLCLMIVNVLHIVSSTLKSIDSDKEEFRRNQKELTWMVMLSTFTIALSMVSVGVIDDTLLFHTKEGIMLSTLSMVMVLYQSAVGVGKRGTNAKTATLPWLYTLSWTLLSVTPFIVPNSSTDYGHTIGATILNVIFFIMAIAANGNADQ